jgi:transposase
MPSEFERTEIIVLHNNGLSNKEISTKMNIHTNVISFWINRHYKNGLISNMTKSGCKRKTTKEQDTKIFQDVQENEKLTLNDIVTATSSIIKISKSTISRRLHENNMVYGNYSKKPLLSEKHKMGRLAWAKDHIDYDWSQVIFSDEMSIWKDRYSNKCWYIKGKQKIKETVKHPIKVHIWGCLTLGGFEVYHLFDYNLNSDKYIDILFEHLVPIYTKEFTYQQDNSSIHNSKKTKEFLKKMNIRMLSFPAISPDLNPIENIWNLIKQYMSKLSDVTNDNFREKIIQCCKKIDYSNIFNIVSSMHIRVKKVIENNGNHIDY